MSKHTLGISPATDFGLFVVSVVVDDGWDTDTVDVAVAVDVEWSLDLQQGNVVVDESWVVAFMLFNRIQIKYWEFEC